MKSTIDAADANILKQFIEEHWAAFEAHCSEQESDPEQIIEALDSMING